MPTAPPAPSASRRARRIDHDLVAAVVATIVVVTALAVVVVGGPLDGGGAAAPSTADAVATAATGTTAATSVAAAAEPASTGFTVGQLHAGEVTPARFAAFWEAQLERIATRPCPAVAPPVGGGTTVVTAFVGATPPDHLGEGYTDYAPLLSAAHAAATARCAT